MGEALQAQALWFNAPHSVELRTEVVPAPEPGQVRVQTIASALSQGTERLVYRGEVPAGMPLDLPTLAGSFGFPIKYGYAALGRVRDVGPAVTTHVPGDLIFALHPHQTMFTVPAVAAIRLPLSIDPLLGLFTANLETAVNIVHDTPLQFGETALIFGQGVVGLLVAQVLRLAGARRVLAVEPVPFRRELARYAGVDAVLEPTANLRDHVRAANNGRAPDVVIEVSGSNVALQAAIDNVVDDGTVVVASWYGTKSVQLMLGDHFHRGRVRMVSSQVGRLNPTLGTRWDYGRRTSTVLDLLPDLALNELITHRIPFTDAATAYHLIDREADAIGQVILMYDVERN